MQVKVNMSELLLEDQLELRKVLSKYNPNYVSQTEFVIVFNNVIEDIFYEYELHNYSVYK